MSALFRDVPSDLTPPMESRPPIPPNDPAPNFTVHNVATALKDGLTLHCPHCHRGHMFPRYFQMRNECEICHVQFTRETGEYVVAMYINLILTEFLFIIGYIITNYYFELPVLTQILIWAPFNLVFPIFFYPRSKGLWAACLYLSGSLYRDRHA